jgi:hypothetical protein
MYTLWRNGELLGRIDGLDALEGFGFDGLIQGILRPTAAFAGTKPVSQTRHPIDPEITWHHPHEPKTIDGAPLPPIEPLAPPPPFAAETRRPLPPSIAASEKFELRTDAGPVDCDSINLSCFIADQDVPLDTLHEQWGTSAGRQIWDDDRQMWMVVAHKARDD